MNISATNYHITRQRPRLSLARQLLCAAPCRLACSLVASSKQLILTFYVSTFPLSPCFFLHLSPLAFPPSLPLFRSILHHKKPREKKSEKKDKPKSKTQTELTKKKTKRTPRKKKKRSATKPRTAAAPVDLRRGPRGNDTRSSTGKQMTRRPISGICLGVCVFAVPLSPVTFVRRKCQNHALD